MLSSLSKKLKLPVALIAVGAMTACWGGSDNSRSDLSTVHINQTMVKNQFNVGFCWSYSLVALLESLEAKKGAELDISEEYLGFYHILSQLKEALNDKTPSAAIDKISEGFMVMDAFKLADKVGLVPEEVFAFKFENPEQAGLEEKIKDFFKEAIKDEAVLANYRKDDAKLKADLSKIFGATPPEPTDKFEFDGKEYTALNFYTDKLNTKSDDYEVVKVNEDNWNISTNKIKATLMNNISVPIGTSTFNGVDDGTGVWDWANCPVGGCPKAGGHAVLAVDFVTEGGRGGEMPIEEAKSVFHNPLDSLIIKNSWGFQGLDQAGVTTTNEALKGFYVYKASFLKEAMKFWDVSVILPKSVINTDKIFVEAGLKVGISSDEATYKRMVELGKEAAFTATLLDVPKKEQAKDVKFSWSLSHDNKIVTETSNENVFKIKTTIPGVYDLTLTVTLGELTDVTTKRIWVMKSQGETIFSNGGVYATSNMAKIKWTGDQGVVEVDATDGKQPVENNNKSTISMPSIEMQPNGKMLVTFTSPAKGIASSPQVSLNGADYKDLRCKNDWADDAHTKTKVKCIFPDAGGLVVEETAKINLRMVYNQMPTEKYKFKGVLKLEDFAVSFAKADFEAQNSKTYVTAEYPAKTTFKRFVSVGDETEFSAVIGSNVDEIAVYVNDVKVKTLPASSTATYVHKAEAVGFSSIKLVAVKDGFESSYVPYELFVTEAIPVTLETPLNVKFSEGNPFASDNSWVLNKFGVSPSTPGADGYPGQLDNNLNSSAVIAVDLSASKQTTLALAFHHNLEKDFDFMFVKISGDGGKTFETLETVTGAASDWVKPVYDLSKYDGKTVQIRFDAISDVASNSPWVIFANAAVVSK